MLLVAVFAVAIFLNAALLFSVQPLFTKMVLPLLGGSPAVWNTCLLFFQTLLLAGYLYAHVTSRWLNPRNQAILHLALLASAVLLLPIHVPASWAQPPGSALPIVWLLGLLAVSLGLPFFLLSAGAPMMQRWFATTRHAWAQNPYFLYAASNLGSFVALLAYPFVIEPRMRISEQSVTWLEFYYVLLVLMGACAIAAITSRRVGARSVITARVAPEPGDAPGVADQEPTIVPDRRLRIRWVLLSFAPSSMLIGVTTYLSTDIAAVPFLWVIPLALYLLTFVLVFARRPLFSRSLVLHAQLLLGLVLVVALCLRSEKGIIGPATLHLLAFFFTAMMCHGELAASRPKAEYLTEFYLWMSFGGMLGGVFNVLVAPVVFNSLSEYAIALVVAFALRPSLSTTDEHRSDRMRDVLYPAAVAIVIWIVYQLPKPPEEWFANGAQLFLIAAMIVVFFFWKRPFRLALGAGAMYAVVQMIGTATSNVLLQDRSFFGMYRVRRVGEYHILQHGTTTHGGQSQAPSRRTEPLTYYHQRGPLADIFANVAQTHVRRVGIVGLGTGAIACYGRPDESWTFYEIDPLVAEIARSPLFSYLRDCAPNTEVVIGDARLQLARAADGEFDLLVVDAFSSDAVPAHLLTREAVALYFRKLRPDGVLAFHISNRYMDLAPVVAALARDANLAGAIGERSPDNDDLTMLRDGSRWIALAKDPSSLADLMKVDVWQSLSTTSGTRLWTDDYSDVLSVIKW